MNTIAGGTVVSSQSYSSSSFQVCQSSGPSFDIIMPEFGDLVPGTEPVNLTLELRVEVTDPDGISMVIGSYKNGSSSIWTNISMSRDTSTSNPDDYAAWPLNYTISEPSFLVIWDIKFYANDSLNNWNVSSIHQMSICRQSSTDTTATSTTGNTTSSTTDSTITIPLLVPLVVTSTFVVIMLPALYVMYRRRVKH